MSMEVNGSLDRKHTKRRKSEQEEKNETKKKRKGRIADEESELASPQKKHRSRATKSQPEGEAQARSLPGPAPTAQKSPFYLQTSSLYLSIAPIAQSHPLAALCAEHISPLLLSYYPPFHGVLISYSNPRLSSDPHDSSARDGRQKAFARSVDEYAATFVWLTAEFLVFRPQRGDVLEGYVNLQSENSISLIYWNFFNASIERRSLPKKWKWIPGGSLIAGGKKKLQQARTEGIPSEDGMAQEHEEGEALDLAMQDDLGYWQDGNGQKVNGLVRFYVKDVETSRSADRENGFLGIEGSISEPAEDHIRAGKGRLTNGSVFGGGGPT